MGLYNVFPMGTTIYDPEKAYNGYTLMQCQGIGAVLVDMNGNVVKVWKDVQGFPNKLLPGGYVMGSLGLRDPKYGYQDQTDLVQVDWDGNVGNLTTRSWWTTAATRDGSPDSTTTTRERATR